MSRGAAVRAIVAELERVQSERKRLQLAVANLHGTLAALEEEETALERARDAIGGGAEAERAPRQSGRTVIVVQAIGRFGLDPWTSAQLVAATGIPVPSVSPILSRLLAQGRIRRTARGEYRTCVARVAS